MLAFCLRKCMIVGTSTNCSPSCSSRSGVCDGMSSKMILGTSITCSATGKSLSKNWRTSTSCSTISGTGASSIGRPGAESTICFTVCRCTRSCGLTPARRSGRDPRGSSSNDSSKSSGWERGVSWIVAVQFCSLPLPPWSWPSSGVVVTLGQGHRDGQTLVP